VILLSELGEINLQVRLNPNKQIIFLCGTISETGDDDAKLETQSLLQSHHGKGQKDQRPKPATFPFVQKIIDFFHSIVEKFTGAAK
jgi:hypothetical protein